MFLSTSISLTGFLSYYHTQSLQICVPEIQMEEACLKMLIWVLVLIL